MKQQVAESVNRTSQSCDQLIYNKTSKMTTGEMIKYN